MLCCGTEEMNNQLYIYDCLSGILQSSDGGFMTIGSGEKNGEKFNGTLVLRIEEKDYADIELKDFVIDDDTITGTMRIIPMDRTMDIIYDLIGEWFGLEKEYLAQFKQFSVVGELQFCEGKDYCCGY